MRRTALITSALFAAILVARPVPTLRAAITGTGNLNPTTLAGWTSSSRLLTSGKLPTVPCGLTAAASLLGHSVLLLSSASKTA